MQTESIIATILLRDSYRRLRIHYLSRILVAAIALTIFSLVGTWSLLRRQPQYLYLMTEPSGHLLPDFPLNQANVNDENVTSWSVSAVTQLFTFDFVNYRRQFQTNQRYLTPIGWEYFQKMLNDSGNFAAVTGNQYVTTAVPNGPASIVTKGLISDSYGNVRYSWTVEVPILITYWSSKQYTTQDLILRVTVVRVPTYVNYIGIQIRQIIAR